MRKVREEEVVIASHNPGKVDEIGRLLNEIGIKTSSSINLGLEEPDETGTTFVENAELKARSASEASGLIALADDSGLVIPALDGAPGVYSARWATSEDGRKLGFFYAIDKIEEKIRNKNQSPENQPAHFVCALSLSWPDGEMVTCEGFVYGSLTFPPRGKKGFGYDPIFKPENSTLTFGEMNPSKKHAISHRANAFTKLSQWCFK